jgi:hypothetical protein
MTHNNPLIKIIQNERQQKYVVNFMYIVTYDGLVSF